ncbi:MAG: glycosyltransferase [Candidatus Omnitrophica bacterium]|nr:glycosyltransferase [Candidatus Omnitrophota bacterium]
MEYAIKKAGHALLIKHSFSFGSDGKTTCEIYKNGEKKIEKKSPGILFNEVTTFAKDFFYTLYFYTRYAGRKFDVFIGANPCNALAGIILKKMGLVSKTVFYIMDYSENRFSSGFLSKAYLKLFNYCMRSSDYVWEGELSDRDFFKKAGVDEWKIVRVPHGVEKNLQNKRKKVKKIVYVGGLTDTCGVDVVLKALPAVIKKIRDAEVTVVGGGKCEQQLKAMALIMQIGGNVRFLGLKPHNEVVKMLPDYDIGIAPYNPENIHAGFAGIGLKIREYFGAGLPVITTRVVGAANVINDKPLGIAVEYDVKEMENAMLKMLTDEAFYEKCRKNIEKMDLPSWEEVFDRALSRIK